ncbi:MAG: DUF1987 domain-containing protein [Bacteroidia bacterium]
MTRKKAEQMDLVMQFLHRWPGIYDDTSAISFNGGESVDVIEGLYERQRRLHKYHLANSSVDIDLEELKKGVATFKPIEKKMLFISLLGKLFDPFTRNLKINSHNTLIFLKELLDIDKESYKNIYSFLSSNRPFSDVKGVVYLAPASNGQIFRCYGYNVQAVLTGEKEIIYTKPLTGTALVMVKYFKVLNEDGIFEEIYRIGSHYLLHSNECIEGGLLLDINEIKKSVETHVPYQDVSVEQTESCPKINLSASTDTISLTGRSIALSPTKYLEPVLQWVELYRQYGGNSLNININLEICNTYTSRFLMRLLQMAKDLRELGRQITVTWCYVADDDEMFEFGMMMQNIFGASFNYVSLTEHHEVDFL